MWQPEQRSEKSTAPCLTDAGTCGLGRDAAADALRAARGEDAGGDDGEGSEQDAATDHGGRHHTRRLPLRRATRGLKCPAPAGLVAAVEAGAGLAGGVRRYCPSSSHGARSRPLPAGHRPLPHRRDRRDLPGPDGPAGLTTNAVASLSLEPVLLLVCFDRASRTLPAVRAARRFAVNILAAGQEDLARAFASKRTPAEKFEAATHRVAHGVPVLDGAVAWLACDLRDLHDGGDHVIGVGAVTACDDDRRASRSSSTTAPTARSTPAALGRPGSPQRQERDDQAATAMTPISRRTMASTTER